MRAEKKSPDGLRITDQYRTPRGMGYDLKCVAVRVTVSVTPRQNQSDPGEWQVEASTGRGEVPMSVSVWAATRAEALSEVGRAWAAKSLPIFDWDAVARALTAVRAL
jgi:hypothetical protein